MKQRIILHAEEFWRFLWGWIPTGFGTLIRFFAYRFFFHRSGRFRSGVGVVIQGFRHITLGSGVGLNRYCSLYSARGEIILGNNVFIGDFSSINANDATITIGDNVAIGPMTLVQGANHTFDSLDIPIVEQGHTHSFVTIESDVWIGGHCTILPGVTLGEGCVVAAGAVVSKDVPPLAVVAGVPARVLRMRGEQRQK